MLQLIPEVFEVKPPTLLYLFSELLGFFLIDSALGLFDERQHVAHPQNPRRKPVRVEGIESVGLFPDTQKLDGLTRDGFNRQRRTAPCVSVDLGENNASKRQCIPKGLCGICRILTCHGIHDKQCLDWVNGTMQRGNFSHHGVINREPARGIYQ